QRLVVFNKTSLADPACSSLWQAHFESRGLACLFMDAGNSRDNGLLVKRLEQMSKPYMEGFRRRGIRPPSPRVMVVGIPNVGKSTLINRLAGKKKQTTGPVPGTTRSLNWVLVKERFHLLDSPGVMLPRIQTDEDAFRFGWIGTLPDHLVGRERVAASLLDHFLPALPAGLFAHYQLSLPPVGMSGQAVLEWLAGQKQVLKKKGVPDTARMAEILMTDFRKGILGRYTLEMPGL
ncbi:MAG: 50S ribosome-binding GTPase, partial [Deltaproteobacteria bacterium]|nr:50S ribosome-binding GTPase [Deltaproteobacteria bacterium]